MQRYSKKNRRSLPASEHRKNVEAISHGAIIHPKEYNNQRKVLPNEPRRLFHDEISHRSNSNRDQ